MNGVRFVKAKARVVVLRTRPETVLGGLYKADGDGWFFKVSSQGQKHHYQG